MPYKNHGIWSDSCFSNSGCNCTRIQTIDIGPSNLRVDFCRFTLAHVSKQGLFTRCLVVQTIFIRNVSTKKSQVWRSLSLYRNPRRLFFRRLKNKLHVSVVRLVIEHVLYSVDGFLLSIVGVILVPNGSSSGSHRCRWNLSSCDFRYL